MFIVSPIPKVQPATNSQVSPVDKVLKVFIKKSVLRKNEIYLSRNILSGYKFEDEGLLNYINF